MSVIEYIGDYIFELASNRRIARQNSVNHRDQILRNLIKIAVFGKESTWARELGTRIREIQMNQLPKKKSKFLSEKEYFHLLYGEMLEPEEPWEDSNTLRYIQIVLEEYKDSRDLYSPLSKNIEKKDIDLINTKIRLFLKEISKLLAEGKAVSNQTNNLINEYVEFWENIRK